MQHWTASGYLLPSQIQANFVQAFLGPMDFDLSSLSYQSQSSFTTNMNTHYGPNTFEGNPLSSFSSDGTFMTTDVYPESTFDHTTQPLDEVTPAILQIPQSSTDARCLAQPGVPDKDFSLIHIPPSSTQLNHSFDYFP